MSIQAAFFCEPDASGRPAMIEHVYRWGRKEQLEALTTMYPEVIHTGNLEQHLPALQTLRVIFSTWGMPLLPPAVLDRLPALEAVFYAAGSVKAFARPLLERGILVVSAWGANAVPVAEFTLAQILLACKGYFLNTRQCRSPEMRRSGQCFCGPGIYDVNVALIGAGQVARHLIRLLRAFRVNILVVDPYLSEEEAVELGVRRVSLEEAFCQAFVVSNHLPNLPETRGMLTERLFRLLPYGATFINTGRGAQVVESDLVVVLRERPDLTALLDVTDPEPPLPDSPLYTLPNVHLTSHIAGSINNEVVRLADAVIEAFKIWQSGGTPPGVVTLDLWDRLA